MEQLILYVCICIYIHIQYIVPVVSRSVRLTDSPPSSVVFKSDTMFIKVTALYFDYLKCCLILSIFGVLFDTRYSVPGIY